MSNVSSDLIYLTDWNSRQSKVFVVDRGDNTIVGPVVGTPSDLWGFAARVDGDVYGLYEIGARLYLRANALEWDCEEITFRYRRVLMLETVSVRRQRKCKFSRYYFTMSRWNEELRDATFDSFDADDIYFLGWCADTISSARQARVSS